MLPSTGATLPPWSDVTLPPVVVTVVNGRPQPACSTPSGLTPSLVVGKTPPFTSRAVA